MIAQKIFLFLYVIIQIHYCYRLAISKKIKQRLVHWDLSQNIMLNNFNKRISILN